MRLKTETAYVAHAVGVHFETKEKENCMFKLIGALKAGEELDNSAKWKNKQLLANTVAIVILAIINGARAIDIQIPLTEPQVQIISDIIAGIIVLINGYLTIATSKKVGL